MVTSSAIGITQQRYMYWKMDKEEMTIVLVRSMATNPKITSADREKRRPQHPRGPSPAERKGLAVDELKTKPRDGALILGGSARHEKTHPSTRETARPRRPPRSSKNC